MKKFGNCWVRGVARLGGKLLISLPLKLPACVLHLTSCFIQLLPSLARRELVGRNPYCITSMRKVVLLWNHNPLGTLVCMEMTRIEEGKWSLSLSSVSPSPTWFLVKLITLKPQGLSPDYYVSNYIGIFKVLPSIVYASGPIKAGGARTPPDQPNVRTWETLPTPPGPSHTVQALIEGVIWLRVAGLIFVKRLPRGHFWRPQSHQKVGA